MENNLLKQQLSSVMEAQGNIFNILESYFFTGNLEHQVGLISNAIQEVVNKMASNDNADLNNEFDCTSQYVQESIHDLAELQKFLVRLHIVYNDYRKQVTEVASVVM